MSAVWIGGGLLAAFALPLTLGRPYWQWNDDVFMAMVAHGFGVSSAPSPVLVFSNVLYGKLVASLGTIGGIQGYTISTYGLLAASGAASAWALWRAGAPALLAAIATFVVFAPVVLYPQFTVLAGLLAVAGLLVLVSSDRAPMLVAAAALLFMAALVRVYEMALVAGITFPLWASLLRERSQAHVRVAVGTLVVVALAVGLGLAIDRLPFRDAAWQPFVTMNDARVWFTDFGLRPYFLAHPLDPMRLGFTPNDFVMLESWFYSDPRLFPAARIEQLAQTVSIFDLALANLRRYDELLVPFGNEAFSAAAVLAVHAAWRARSRPALWAFGLLAGMMAVALLAGRPGITRIYVAPVAAIALFSLIRPPARAVPLEALLATLVLLGLCLALAMRNRSDQHESEAMRAKLCDLPTDRLYVVWGDKLPYERLYRPLSVPGDHCPLRIYPLAVYSYAPNAVEQLRAATGHADVIGALLAGREIDLIASYWQVDVLRRHLRIHYGRKLDWKMMRDDGLHGVWFSLRLLDPAKR